MLRSPMSRCVLIAAIFIFSSHAALASPFTNGDFEGGTYPQTFGASNDTLPNSWTNSPPTAMSNLDVFATGSGPGSPQSGTHYVAFQSAESDGSQDCLNQIFTTVLGQKYTISFWVSMTASSGSQFGLSPEWDAGGGANDTWARPPTSTFTPPIPRRCRTRFFHLPKPRPPIPQVCTFTGLMPPAPSFWTTCRSRWRRSHGPGRWLFRS